VRAQARKNKRISIQISRQHIQITKHGEERKKEGRKREENEKKAPYKGKWTLGH
jgi:hypothetical protein